ncbi:fumarylacetoacetase [Aquamicrobium defluvii]|uniref:fumarylacetoacetase n=1 Tax=Aquamicrobium defluvii TaxID=69279 RepID=A0A011SQN6_9HYPH|nr:fumarylacetoacetase [Aquamicrobium defluvii]EXL01484.1 fumarylacetoacetase [Aquamicrobium defluvii]EZQ12727.1 fumarylacetoacetase [Halopseudomonas bauzanensis]
MNKIDETHDPARQSWVVSANGHSDFPLQNLPFGIFSTEQFGPRGGVAIGDHVLDLSGVAASSLLTGDVKAAAEAASGPVLNDFLALGAHARRALRGRLFELLASDSAHQEALKPLLYRQFDVELHLPARIGDYTDFYVGIHHAMNVGRLFRPDNPLLPNYKYVPIGYHGRSSSILPSGTNVRRPLGQSKGPEAEAPAFGPSQKLDYELELGVWIGPGNDLGKPIAIDRAADHIAGFCLLNDWSARDLQAWEYQPLGPFLAKNFASTISPWIITPEALAPFRATQPVRPTGDPAPLPHLWSDKDQAEGSFDLELEVLLHTPGLKQRDMPAHRIALSNTRYMYWTVAQMVAHHTSNGCNFQPGDLLGTGTISGPGREECGSILEATSGGRVPILLPSGEERRFLEDGDEVILRVRGHREGYTTIGFGECRSTVLPAM